MARNQLCGEDFAGMIRGGTLRLRENAAKVNDLNVFPIPDGDTGDNMYKTVAGGAKALETFEGGSLSAAASAAAEGMLLGARGNSGVILSQFFSGIAHAFDGCHTADVADLGEAFRRGVEQEYRAVLSPVEGTILTVSREATEYACGRIGEGSTVESFLADFSDELSRSLERTPEQLEVLRQAGVVDSGGAGFKYIADGMRDGLAGIFSAAEAPAAEAQPAAQADLSVFGEDSRLEFGYCCEFLLRLQRVKTDPDSFDVASVTPYLEEIGNSVVAVKTGSILKVHVHTMTPGEVLTHFQQYGEFLTLKIENMMLQHGSAAPGSAAASAGNKPARRKPFAVVAAATGAGIIETFRSLGADAVIDGGKSMNPSAEDFVRAIEEAGADTVFVLPDNGNATLAARQAAKLCSGVDVRVLPAKTLGDGYAVLSMLDYSAGDADAIAKELTDAMDGVVTGMVSRTVRDSELDGVTVHKGDYAGFTEKRMVVAEDNRVDAVCCLAKALDAAGRDVLLLVKGAAAAQAEADEAKSRLDDAYPSKDIFLLDGGHELYDFMLILE